MFKERLDIENVEIESAQRAGRKNRNKTKTIVCNSYNSKLNKIF